jgi:hypothetical protein
MLAIRFPQVKPLQMPRDPFVLNIAKSGRTNIAASGFFTQIYASLTLLDIAWLYSLFKP